MAHALPLWFHRGHGIACGVAPGLSVFATGGLIVFELLLLLAIVFFAPAVLFLFSVAFGTLWVVVGILKRLFGPNPDADKPSSHGSCLPALSASHPR